jgi:hypothetical protein
LSGRGAGRCFVKLNEVEGLAVGPTEWVLLIVFVILIPLAIAVTVTLWSLEQARQRTKRNRPGAVRRRVALPDAAEEGAAAPLPGADRHDG